jgi:TM2 domain-containing membrane protein YozV
LEHTTALNIGDIVMTLFAFLIIITIIIAIVFFIRYMIKRRSQLDRIEEKIDIIFGQTQQK